MQNFKNNKRIERIEEIKEEEKSLSEFYKNSDNLNLPNSFQEATLSFGENVNDLSFRK